MQADVARAGSVEIRHPLDPQKANVVPAVNQVEVHPFFQQREVQALNAEHGILTEPA